MISAKKPSRDGSLGGLGLVVHLGAPALLGFEFPLFLEFASGLLDNDAGMGLAEGGGKARITEQK